MPVQVTNYQCPSCTGPLHFSEKSGKLECEYCGSSFEAAEIEALYAQNGQAQTNDESAHERAEAGSCWGDDAEQIQVYSCPSCGAELICDVNTAATSCPYCGNPSIIPGKLGGALKPDYVIPFKLNRQDAVAALKKFYKKKRLLPGSFASANHIEEIQGVYVPFWLFDQTAEADVEFRGERISVIRSGDEEITTTKHYAIHRSGTVTFEKVPVDGSTKMPDGHMDAIEPFDYTELTPFSTAYLPGFLADKYDVSSEKSAGRAQRRAAESAVQALRATVHGYDAVREQSRTVNIRQDKISYALLPVWMLSTKWNGKNYLFAMNGQTGKLVGDLPVSWKKFWGYFLGIAAGISAVLGLLFG